jgi:hypothetical protein
MIISSEISEWDNFNVWLIKDKKVINFKFIKKEISKTN